MNLTRCPKGHFYDAEKYPACPHCAPGAGSDNETVSFNGGGVSDEGKTISGKDLINEMAGKGNAADVNKNNDTVSGTTIPVQEHLNLPGFIYADDYCDDPPQPVVGWLVCTKGRHMGKDYRLVTGRNFIGRSGTMSVALEGENSVSRENHAIVAYEPRQSIFIAQPGSASELFYLNGSVVLDPVRLKQGDRLLLGEVELMLIPCCDDKFKWEIKK